MLLRQVSRPLRVAKAGLEATIHGYATDYGYLYGIFAVALAILTGWLGRVLFKRD
ncbi:TIGR02186 family protein [Consotaella aegiceratis]|uniref:TIGR02186 family protein n=1 Tax=Consotaella aegiceratis TaxID=3097961 RepID=UPI003D80607D